MSAEAAKLHKILKTTCNAEIDVGLFVSSFKIGLKRSRTTDEQEFSALIFANIWEIVRKDGKITKEQILAEIDSAKDKLRSQVNKGWRYDTKLDLFGLVDKRYEDVPEIAARNEFSERIGIFLSGLAPEEALIFNECVLNRNSVDKFIEKTNISRSSAYRARERLKKKFKLFLFEKD